MARLLRAQKTIAREGALSGIGLHTGAACTVRFKPAASGEGIQLLQDGISLGVVGHGPDRPDVMDSARCTALGKNGRSIRTVEHVLAALAGLEITNIRVDVRGPEMPGLDGSAAPFVRFLKELGLAEQPERAEVYVLKEPVFCSETNKALAAYPSADFSVSYTLDYDHAGLREQTVQFTLTPGLFEAEIAPARTFCTARDAREAVQAGLGRGAGSDSTIVISEGGTPSRALHFPDECARHKVLDLVGDLSLLGFPVAASFIGLRSGHSLNRKMVQEILKQRGSHDGS